MKDVELRCLFFIFNSILKNESKENIIYESNTTMWKSKEKWKY